MRFILGSISGLAVVSISLFGAVSSAELFERTDITSDVCGDVHALLKVPVLKTGIDITIGIIDACLCKSTISEYASTNLLAIGASAVSSKANVINALNDMLSKCSDKKTCNYPPHSLPVCKKGNPCSFTCKDGYSASPYGDHPTKCVCEKPYKECNGKCGIFHGCPSEHVKREMRYGGSKCPKGKTACGVWGRNARTWECIDTQNDLESCGGCVIPHPFDHSGEEGQDCTALPSVSDVSCIKGQCIVHRCDSGYELDESGRTCVYSEDKDPVLLASQFGLEYDPSLED